MHLAIGKKITVNRRREGYSDEIVTDIYIQTLLGDEKAEFGASVGEFDTELGWSGVVITQAKGDLGERWCYFDQIVKEGA